MSPEDLILLLTILLSMSIILTGSWKILRILWLWAESEEETILWSNIGFKFQICFYETLRSLEVISTGNNEEIVAAG